jgi:hypothetical protein
MTVAVDLLEAANLTPQNLRPLWEADTLQTKMIAFWQAINPSFEEQTPNDHPVADWIALIAAMAPSLLPFAANADPGATPWAGGTITTFGIAVDYVYRLCKFGFYYTLISPTQKAAILTAYNAQFA